MRAHRTPTRPLRRRALGAATALLTAVAGAGVTALAAPAAAVSPDVVISQVYGGGGNAGATWRNDFVELQNRGSAAVDVGGWSVQYASAAGTSWAVTSLTGSIPPGGYYLVQQAAGAGGTTPLPTPDATGSIALSGTNGKVALVTNATPLAGCAPGCPTAPAVRDFVGYGSANEAEGAPTPALTNTTAAVRGSGADSDNNAADFTVGAPDPRNSGGVEPPPPPPPTDCTAADVPVGAVQGTTDTSPLVGTTVSVQGTVVGDYEGPSPALRGFYLQDDGDGDAATSDGVFVFNNVGGTSPDAVTLGQQVQVTGTVAEFQGQTQVTATAVVVCGAGGPVAPVDVTLPRQAADDLEPFEGMLVRLAQTLVVTEHFQLGRFGEVLVSSGERLRQPTAVVEPGAPARALQARNDLDQLLIDDATNRQNPPTVFGRGGQPLSAANTLRGGDTVTDPVGVLTYTFGGASASPNAFRLRPEGSLGGTVTFVAANPRPEGVPDVGGTLRVASFNLLNFFDTFAGCTFGAGGAAADCRGAENAVEFERQVAKTVPAMTSLGADVVGVMELENDGYGEGTAIDTLVDALNAADGAGRWAAVDADAGTGTVNAGGTDAIKVALLYRPDRVTPLPGLTFADTAGGTTWDRVPVAQTFRTRTGADVTVVANHFKSKGSCPTAQQPDPPNADAGDGQSCWNARRVAQAQRLADWLAGTVVPAAGDDVLVIGDLNAYANEDPIDVLEAAGYVNLPRQLHGDETYSYVFDGQWGYLDYALGSPSLAATVTGADEVHINADEPSVLDYNTNFKSPAQVASFFAPDRFRTSDHDPVLAGFDVKGATTTTVTSSAPDVLYRGEVRWTATVASQGVDGPTGTVQFTLGGTPFGTPVPLVDGVATSAATAALPPGATAVGAVYSGSDGNAASTGTLTQQVRFGVRIVRPDDGAAPRAGSTVQVRVVLTDARGTVPDAVARRWAAACRLTVAATGAQPFAPRCVREYDARDDRFELAWKTARSPRGEVTLTATVVYPGITDGDTDAVNLRLR